MKLLQRILALIVLAPALSGVVQAEIYQWVDANGVINHSDSPPPGLAARKSDIKPEAQPGHPATENLSPDMNIEISGVVQDSHGKPLRGVTMTILERRPVSGRLESREVRKKQKVNGAFTLSCQNCPIASLRFRAPGYSSKKVTLEFTAEENAEIEQRLVDRMSGNTNPAISTPIAISRENLVVVLEQESKFPRISRIDGQLALTQDGPLRVLAGKPPSLKQMPYSYAGEKFIDNGTADNAAMLLPSLQGTSYMTLIRANEANTLHTLSDRLRIELAGAEGGFVTVTPAARAISDKINNMQEAPEYGYKPQLDIAFNARESVYFYCKIGSFHGKGRIMHEPRMDRLGSHSILSTHVEILMNRDGGRNLKTQY